MHLKKTQRLGYSDLLWSLFWPRLGELDHQQAMLHLGLDVSILISESQTVFLLNKGK
jgi:hypothetical protein